MDGGSAGSSGPPSASRIASFTGRASSFGERTAVPKSGLRSTAVHTAWSTLIRASPVTTIRPRARSSSYDG